jgi:hypothetical protein
VGRQVLEATQEAGALSEEGNDTGARAGRGNKPASTSLGVIRINPLSMFVHSLKLVIQLASHFDLENNVSAPVYINKALRRGWVAE